MRGSSVLGTAAALAGIAIAVPVKQDPSLGKLPAMGFNSWNAFRCDIDEEKFLTAAQKMVDLGLKDIGFEYINIDDCWSIKGDRDSTTGRIRVDLEKFPDGIKGTADKIHSMGLKLGIYSDAGETTCAGYPGSLLHEETDAQAWAEWGVDYLKYDNCAVPAEWNDKYFYYPENWYGDHYEPSDGPEAPIDFDWSKSNQSERYYRMRDALAKVDRPIFYSLCNWGHGHVERWGKDVGQSWRMWGDIWPAWDGKYEWSWGFMPILNHASFFAEYTDFYGRNDFDMLEVGNGNLTLAETRSHYALWAALKSPLLIGTPLDKIAGEDLEILKNWEIIAFNQDDKYGASVLPFKWGINPDWTWNRTHPAEYYSGQSKRGIHAFVLNSRDVDAKKELKFGDVPGLKSGKTYEVRDMWTHKSLGKFKNKMTLKLGAKDTAALLITEKGGKHPWTGKLPKPKIWKDKPIETVWPLPKGYKPSPRA